MPMTATKTPILLTQLPPIRASHSSLVRRAGAGTGWDRGGKGPGKGRGGWGRGGGGRGRRGGRRLGRGARRGLRRRGRHRRLGRKGRSGDLGREGAAVSGSERSLQPEQAVFQLVQAVAEVDPADHQHSQYAEQEERFHESAP